MAWLSGVSIRLKNGEKVATSVKGKAMPCGHYIPEEAPDSLYDELMAFL